MHSGWFGGGVIGFAWTAAQGVGGLGTFPYPYIHIVRIDVNTVTNNYTFTDEPVLWASSFAFTNLSTAPNVRGHAAMSALFSEPGYNPSVVLATMDDLSGSGWSLDYNTFGSNTPNDDRVGDYVTVRAASGNGTTWVATG